jgi:hypothetical protein
MGLLDNLLPSTVMVQRKARTPDGQGGHTITFEDDHTEVVYIGQPTGKDVPVAHRKEGLLMFPVYGNADADIRIGDRLKLGSRLFEVRVAHLGVPGGPYEKWMTEEYVG